MGCTFVSFVLVSLLTMVFATGKFEVSVLGIFNKLGLKENGHCCRGSRDLPPCAAECETFLTICLLHYTTLLPENPTCTYGKARTPVLGGNTVNKTSLADFRYFPLSMPFNFSWPRAFSLVIEAWHDAHRNTTRTERSHRIMRVAIVDELLPTLVWTYNNTEVNQSHIWFKYRVICDENYYGETCDTFCRDRDDQFGHYICNGNGSKTCLPGWQGNFCQQAICSSSCNTSHGYCEEPYECRCQYGWTGTSCNQCIPNPACVHGTCETPWQCICKDGWIGRNCDIDLMYCVKYRPCINGGTCSVDVSHNFSCTCPAGFAGSKCEIPVCYDGYCRNGGICQMESNERVCTCTDKFYGDHCEVEKVMCEDITCLHDGTCYFGEYGAMCSCEKGYTGIFCEREIDECLSQPCANGGTCLDGFNDYFCKCAPNYLGKNCDIHLDPCKDYCFHGGSCSVVGGGFTASCNCHQGFTGLRCEYEVNPCRHITCQNGGTCKYSPVKNEHSCHCQQGFEGEFCESEIDPCKNTPCLNGGICKKYFNDSICVCPQQYSGPHCDILLFPSDQSVTHAPTTNADVNATSSVHGSIQRLFIISAIAVSSTFLIVVFNTRRWCCGKSKTSLCLK